MITKTDIIEAHLRLRPIVHKTPILTSASINIITGSNLFFKCENLQKSGAFKYRGATNAISQLNSSDKVNGVVTHSSGNHGQALSLAAKKAGIKCYVIMPNNSPQVKINAVNEYGGIITLCPPTLADREKFTESIIQNTGAKFIHPYNNMEIITGQATAAKELIESQPNLDYIITPVGGGGLLSGTILSSKYFSSQTKVIAVEPEGANDAFRSLKSGVLVKSHTPNTIADGLLTTIGNLNWEIIKPGVSDILLVNDKEIMSALELIIQRMKIIVEPSSATVLAAVLKNKALFKDKKVGLIISGGNFNPFPTAIVN